MIKKITALRSGSSVSSEIAGPHNEQSISVLKLCPKFLIAKLSSVLNDSSILGALIRVYIIHIFF